MKVQKGKTRRTRRVITVEGKSAVGSGIEGFYNVSHQIHGSPGLEAMAVEGIGLSGLEGLKNAHSGIGEPITVQRDEIYKSKQKKRTIPIKRNPNDILEAKVE